MASKRRLDVGVIAVTWDQINSNWKQLSSVLKERWDRLTDDDLMKIAGKREQFARLLQVRYGYAQDEAVKAVDDFAWEMKL